MKVTLKDRDRAIKDDIEITAYTTKTSLIRQIQSHEGHEPCFRTDLRFFCKETCEWKAMCEDCLIASWKR